MSSSSSSSGYTRSGLNYIYGLEERLLSGGSLGSGDRFGLNRWSRSVLEKAGREKRVLPPVIRSSHSWGSPWSFRSHDFLNISWTRNFARSSSFNYLTFSDFLFCMASSNSFLSTSLCCFRSYIFASDCLRICWYINSVWERKQLAASPKLESKSCRFDRPSVRETMDCLRRTLGVVYFMENHWTALTSLPRSSFEGGESLRFRGPLGLVFTSWEVVRLERLLG